MTLGNFDIAGDGTEARILSGNVQSKALAANVAETITVPTSGQQANRVIFASTADFYIKGFATAPADIVTNGGFTADTDWTKGIGWTIAAGVATATGAISTALEQTLSTTIVEGRAYLITYTTTRSAGGVKPSLGGTLGTEVTDSAIQSEVIIAGSSQVLAFTGNAFSGTVDVVSVIEVATVPVDNTTGEAAELIKANCDETSRSFICTNVEEFSIIAPATTVVTASFFHI